MKWSQQVWQQAQPIYQAILDHPFVAELAAGTLSRQRFMFYISQDSIYVGNYCRVLLHIASRLADSNHRKAFIDFAADGIAVEQSLHESYLADDSIARSTQPSPACLLYTSFESAQGFEPVEVEAAAILPCFWIYHETGQSILTKASDANPYHRWIATYADEAFARSTRLAIDICDTLAENTTPAIRQQMTRAFLTAARMEWLFWDSAYNMQQWKI